MKTTYTLFALLVIALCATLATNVYTLREMRVQQAALRNIEAQMATLAELNALAPTLRKEFKDTQDNLETLSDDISRSSWRVGGYLAEKQLAERTPAK